MIALRLAALVLVLVLASSASAAAAGVRLSSRDEPLVAARTAAGTERVLPPRRAPLRFNLVGLHWRGSGQVSFRTQSVSGRWSPWRNAQPEAEDRPDPGTEEARARAGWRLGNPYWTGQAKRIQYRLRGEIVRLRAHFLSSPLAPLARRPATAPMPRVVRRAAWGADESIVRGRPEYADRLVRAVVHHTAGARPSSPRQSAAIVRAIQVYHVKSNGWNDVGYNFLVDPFGQIFEGRAGGVTRNVIGAHAQGFNTGTVGVAVLGSYGSGTISARAREALVSLVAWRLDLAHVDPSSQTTSVSLGSPKFPRGTSVTLGAVSGHRDTGLTSCPGAALYGELGQIAAAATSRGLPKLYDPRATASIGGPVRFTARLSAPLEWTVTVFDATGQTVASGAGYGARVDWTWDATGVGTAGLSYVIGAGPNVRPARGSIGRSTAALMVSGFGAQPTVVTPNGDGASDRTQLRVAVTKPATLSVWLEDDSGTRLATVLADRAVGAGTTRVWWNGSGVPDGRYQLVAAVVSGAERASRAAPVVVDRTLGSLVLRPTPFSPNDDARRDTLFLRFQLARPAGVRVQILRGSRTVSTLFSGSLTAGSQALSWNGRARGAALTDGRYRAVVGATTDLGTRRLGGEVVLDTTKPRISRLSASRSGSGTLVRLRLSEPALVVLRVGTRTFTAKGQAGAVRVWRPALAAQVEVVASDPAGNTSPPLVARVAS